jgi:hypothetical protein
VQTAPSAGRTQTRVRAWLGEKTTLTGGVHLPAREGGREVEAGRVGELGRGRGAGLRGGKKERSQRAGPCGEREEESRPAGLGPQEKKERGRVGRAQLEKEGEKELCSNTFEFEFEI